MHSQSSLEETSRRVNHPIEYGSQRPFTTDTSLDKVSRMTKNSLRSWIVKASLAVASASAPHWKLFAKHRFPESTTEFQPRSATPDQDFFRYVNDVWLKKTPIPDDQSDYGAFTALDIETKRRIRQLIEKASPTAHPSSLARQVGSFYKSYTDLANRNRLGAHTYPASFEDDRRHPDQVGLMSYQGRSGRRGISVLFGVYIDSMLVARINTRYTSAKVARRCQTETTISMQSLQTP